MHHHKIRINIPTSELEDFGNPVKLCDKMIQIFKYHNHSKIKKGSKNIFPIEHIQTIARSKKSKEVVENVINRWENWKKKNANYYNKLDDERKVSIQEKRVLEQIVTSNIYIEFDRWLDYTPECIDYALGKWNSYLLSDKLSDLEPRMVSFTQCKFCCTYLPTYLTYLPNLPNLPTYLPTYVPTYLPT